MMRNLALLLIGLALGEASIRNSWRVGLSDFDFEMWRYAREIKVISKNPDIGLEHQPDVEANLMGVRVRTDQFGFRKINDADRSDKESSAIMLFGDSATLGWGVQETETYAAHLQNALPGFRVFNAGIGNTNTSMQVSLLKSYLNKGFRPDWIIFGYTVNDPEPNPNLREGFQVADLALGFMFKKLISFAGVRSGPSYADYYKALYNEESEGWKKWKSTAEELAQISKARSIPVTVLLIPEMHQPYEDGPFKPEFEKVAQYFTNLGLEVVNPSLSFSKGDGSNYWVTPGDPHPNSEAHRIFAAALLKSRYGEKIERIR